MKTQVLSLLIRFFGALLSAGQTVLLARIMGSESLGIYASILALTAVLAIPASAGLGEFLTRETAISKSKGNINLVRGLIIGANKLLVVYSIISMLLLVVLTLIGIAPPMEALTLLLACLIIPLASTDRLRTGAMRGMGSALVSQIPENIIRPGVFLISVTIYAFVIGDVGIKEALASYVLGGVWATAFGQIALRRQLRGYGGSEKVSLPKVARASAGQTALGGTQTLLSNIDIAILSAFAFYSAAGTYKVALLGVVALLFVYNSMSAVAVRDLAFALARSSRRHAVRISDRLTTLGTIATAAIAALYALVGKEAIPAIFGREFELAYSALLVLAVGHLVGMACGPSSEIVRLMKSQRTSVTINLLGLLVVVLVSVALLSWNPLLAVSIGTAAGNVFRRLLLAIHISRELGFDPSLVGCLRRKFAT